jgi:hypothetical protein
MLNQARQRTVRMQDNTVCTFEDGLTNQRRFSQMRRIHLVDAVSHEASTVVVAYSSIQVVRVHL